MIVYVNRITPRLQYVTDFLGKQITGEPFQLTTDNFYFNDYNGPKINYGYDAVSNDEFLVVNYPLLFEDSIKRQNISCFTINDFKAFFKSDGDYPFDIFSAVFYLLSRYEEYLPNEKDEYGRYAYENSLAYKEGFLHIPLVNTWIEDFRKALKKRFPSLNLQPSTFNQHMILMKPLHIRIRALEKRSVGLLSQCSLVNGQGSVRE